MADAAEIVAYTACQRLERPFLTPHPFACRMWGCRAPVVWRDEIDTGVGVGYCDGHRAWTPHACTPIAIYGGEGDDGGWQRWPADVRLRLAIERERR
jgi:hypothetical protein